MLRRLGEDDRAALLVMGKGLAFSAYGRAAVIAEELDAAETVVAVELRVEHVQDHLADGRTDMVDGARWPAIASARFAWWPGPARPAR